MSPPVDLTRITLAVLAGGRGRRMGIAKSHLCLAGIPILQYLLESIQWPGPTLLVTAPSLERPPGHPLFNAEATDPVTQGPLGGILTALQNSSTSLTIMATVDMPAIRRWHLQWVVDRLASYPDLSGVMLSRVIPDGNQIEPFPFACRATAIDIIASRLMSEDHSVHSLTALPQFAAHPAPPDWPGQVWTNLNTQADYENFVLSIDDPK